MPGKGNGGSQPTPSEEHPAHHGEDAPSSSGGFVRGLDSGLAKSAPTAEGLNAKTYRAYRRRLLLFSKQCGRRGVSVAVEGAFLAISLLQDTAWDATEQLNLDEIERSSEPFQPIFKLLDRLYQHEEDVELPARCEEFFQEFSRLKNEEMQAYILRHATLQKKLKEVGITLPDLLSGWHLLSRAGVPRWTHLQVKALCGGTLEYNKVAQALLKVFGGDHRPNQKDLFRGSGETSQAFVNDVNEEIYYDDADEGWYDYGSGYVDYLPEDEVYWEDEAEAVVEGDTANYDDDGGIDEYENAAEAMEEAYMNYVDSRRRMRDIALSRGFFPVVAMPPSDWMSPSGRHEKGKSKGKGRAKGKGKSKGKGKGGDKGGFRNFAFNRRPVAGIRRDAAANIGRPTSDVMRSTGSGSTAQHGPRFKRYRLQDAIKPVEETNMVEDLILDSITEPNAAINEVEACNVHASDGQNNVYFNDVGPGYAILDSGATRSVIGEQAWQKWLELLSRCGAEVSAKKVVRDFRFGDGSTVRSTIEVSFPAMVYGHLRNITASLIRNTPLLLARPVLEEWQMIQDFSSGKIRLFGEEIWRAPARTQNGHFLLQLLEDTVSHKVKNDADDDVYVETPLDLEPKDEEGTPDRENNEVKSEYLDEAEIAKAIASAEEAVYYSQSSKKKMFWELFVDQGNLSKEVAKYPGMECSTFTLPEWDFERPATQCGFLDLMRKLRPSHLWLARHALYGALLGTLMPERTP